MKDVRTAAGPLAILLLVALAAVLSSRGQQATVGERISDDGARYRMTSAAAGGDGTRPLPAAAPLRFAGPIAAGDRQVILDVIAEARPEARRLVEAVEGLVTVSLGDPGAGNAGLTSQTPAGYDVELDLGGVYRRLGMRGVRRLVLHELAHVVDSALVPVALERELDAGIPAGFGCDDGLSGACAARPERFAESFAKWATGDIGADLYLGYRVPPPTSLSDWGAPLAALTR